MRPRDGRWSRPERSCAPRGAGCPRRNWFAASLCVSSQLFACSPNAQEEADPTNKAPVVRENTGPVLCGDGERCGNDPVDENDPTHVTTEGPGTVVF